MDAQLRAPMRAMRRKDADMSRLVFGLSPAVCLAVALSVRAAGSVPVALLSVATGKATLDLARPESMRPVFYPKPLPYTDEMILKLGDLSARHAMLANERVAAENERNAAIVLQADRDEWSRRENLARHELRNSNLGKAVLKVPELFSTAITNGLPFVMLSADSDRFVPAIANALFVRLLFEEPRFNPPPPVLPNTSDRPINVTLPVMLKVEDAAGNAIAFEKYEQTAVASNPDHLIGPAQRTFMEALVSNAVETAVSKLP